MDDPHGPVISVVLPGLNESVTVAASVQAAHLGVARTGLSGEVLVVDNGSTDDSAALVEAAGASVVHEPNPGYGATRRRGFAAARGRFLVMADADDTYDLAGLAALVAPLQDGYDLALGNRLVDVQPGAMPWLHRRIGTPLISWVLRRTYGVHIRDSQSGFCSFTRPAIDRLRLRSSGTRAGLRDDRQGCQPGPADRRSRVVLRSPGGGEQVTNPSRRLAPFAADPADWCPHCSMCCPVPFSSCWAFSPSCSASRLRTWRSAASNGSPYSRGRSSGCWASAASPLAWWRTVAWCAPDWRARRGCWHAAIPWCSWRPFWRWQPSRSSTASASTPLSSSSGSAASPTQPGTQLAALAQALIISGVNLAFIAFLGAAPE